MEVQNDFGILSLMKANTEIQSDFVGLDLLVTATCQQNSIDYDSSLACETKNVRNVDVQNVDVSDGYVPVNYICPEVYALFAAWESASRLRVPSDPSIPRTVTMQDPKGTQSQDSFGPPKRFYRTAWKSLCRKLKHVDSR
jgi:hypothetical protein